MLMYYSYNLNPRLCVAVSRHLGISMEYRHLRKIPAEERAEVAAANPMGRVPVLLEQGRPPLWETDAITCRLSMLAGSDFWRQGEAQIEMIRWISWATMHLNRAADPLYFNYVAMPTFTDKRLPPAELERSLAEWRRYMPILDSALAERDWLVDSALSYADFRAACVLPFADQARLPLGDFPNVARWHDRLMELPAWNDPFDGLD